MDLPGSIDFRKVFELVKVLDENRCSTSTNFVEGDIRVSMKVVGVYNLKDIVKMCVLDLPTPKNGDKTLPKLELIRRIYLSRVTLANLSRNFQDGTIDWSGIRLIETLVHELEVSLENEFDALYSNASLLLNRAESLLREDESNQLYSILLQFKQKLENIELSGSSSYSKILKRVLEALENFDGGDLEDFLDSASKTLDCLERLQSHKIIINLTDSSVLELEKLVKDCESRNNIYSSGLLALESHDWFVSKRIAEKLSQSSHLPHFSHFMIYNDTDFVVVCSASSLTGNFENDSRLLRAIELYGSTDIQIFLLDLRFGNDSLPTMELFPLLDLEICFILNSILESPLNQEKENCHLTFSGKLLFTFDDEIETGCPLALDDGFEIACSAQDPGKFTVVRRIID